MNKRLKKLLEERNMRPEELALSIGVSVATIGRLHPFKSPRKPLAIALAATTGISLEELFPSDIKDAKKAG